MVILGGYSRRVSGKRLASVARTAGYQRIRNLVFSSLVRDKRGGGLCRVDLMQLLRAYSESRLQKRPEERNDSSSA